jgi:predicted RNA-binding protein with EMAP domain
MPSADIIHHSLLFIKACYISLNNLTENNVFIQVNKDNFDLLHFKNDQVNFFNNFKFNNNTDIVYYLLAVAEELGISGDLNLIVYGEIDSNNSLFSVLEKYFKNMQLGKRNLRFTYPIAFDKIPEHHYFTALNVLLCE